MNRTGLILGFVAGIILVSLTANAQYYASFQTNIISGVTNSWEWDYFVGEYFSFDALLIQNGGVLPDQYGGVGVGFFDSQGNSALVTGPGSVWSNTANFIVGDSCSSNSVVIRNGGKVVNAGGGYIGHNDWGICSNNTVLVFDVGSIWKSDGDIEIGGSGSSWNSLVISNSGQVFDQSAYVGNADSASNNTVLVSGSSSVWSNRGSVYVGDASAGNSVTISNNGRMFVSSLVLGRLMLNGGSLTVDTLIANNESGSSVEFDSGLLITKGTVVSNGTAFIIGDGIHAATLHLMGGTHSFADGLWIRTNSSLRGCGEVDGNTLVEGTVLADCGGTLLFTGVITNNGTIELQSSTFLECHGQVINNGTIIATNGTLACYSGFENHGTILGTVQDMLDNWTNSSSGKWEEAPNWSRGAPTNAFSCMISNAGNKTVTMDAATAFAHAETLTVESLTLGGSGGTTNTLLLSNSGTATSLRTRHELVVGKGGKLAISNGAVEVGVFLGRSLTVDGDVSMSAATLAITNGPALLGTSGLGEMVVSNSTVLSGEVRLGYAVASSRRLNVAGTGSVWNDSGTLFIGDSGSSNCLVISDGGVVASRFSYLGYAAGSVNNSVMVGGTGSVWTVIAASWNAPILNIGYQGAGNSLVISNGGKVISNSSSLENFSGTCVGCNTGSSNNSVLVTGSGSVWSNRMALWIENGSKVAVDGDGEVVCPYIIVGGENGGVEVSVSQQSSLGGLDDVVGGEHNCLAITAGGRVTSTQGSLGSWDNGQGSAVVTGPGSVWNNSDSLMIGDSSSGNTLVISNGGQLVSNGGLVGFGYSGNGNKVVVSSPGSVWSNQSSLSIGGVGDWGDGGSDNMLVIENEGEVVNGDCTVGYYSNSGNNGARVSDGGVWQNNGLYIGNEGSSNSLVVAGGTVFATNLVIGFNSPTCDNLVQLDNGSVIVTNAIGDAEFEVRYGELILNGGTLQVDRFVMTNSCAQFVRTGGTLIYGTAVLDPNRDDDGDGMPNGWEQSHGLDPLNAADANSDADGDGMTNLQEFLAGTDPTNSASAFRIVEVVPDDDDMLIAWTAVGGKRYALQTTTGYSGSFSNNFIDLNPAFIAPGTGETEIAVLHLGGATNSPARYYRVRLVP